MQLKRKTKRGNLKWSSSTVVNLLRNERYCGDAFEKDHLHQIIWITKAKNRHDRNQYRQNDHHEAIVDREVYNAAQKCCL